MIIHRHHDGSEGIQYEIGDRVIVERTIQGGWFDFGPTHAEICTVERIEKGSHWRTARMDIRYSHEWGCADVFPWHLRPHPSTTAREIVHVPEAA